MATKTYRARIVQISPRLGAALERTHYLFAEALNQMVRRYIDMRKGKYGQECKKLADIMLTRSNTFAHGVMDQLTREISTSGLTDEWVDLARAVHKSHGPLFLQHDGFAEVDGVMLHTKRHGKVSPMPGRLPVNAKFWHQVCDSASAFLKSNNELLENWRQGRKEWLQEKADWESANADFMRFWNGSYQEFEETCEIKRKESQALEGQKVVEKKRHRRDRGKRMSRWHLWYNWVITHPEIIEWRNRAKAAEFRPVPPTVHKKIKNKYPRQDKHITKFLDWLKENNPELKALDSRRRFYVRNYLRFRRPPTLTLPSANKHPYWFTFELNQFYKNVDFDKGSIQLLLVDETEEGSWFFRWFDAKIQCDPRLRPCVRAGVFATKGRYPPYIGGKVGNKLNRPAERPENRKAGYAGAKLVLNKRRKELFFTVIEQDCPRKVSWKKTKQRTCRGDNVFAKDGSQIPLKVMAIDLGIRHIGAYVIAEACRNRGVWDISWQHKGITGRHAVPGLKEIRQHDRQLRKARSQRGKPVQGEESFIELQDHRTNMADDRFKKAANTIVELARQYDVHLILFERLGNLSPTAFDERWMNRQLRDMNRRQIVDTVKLQAREFGIECLEDISPWMTSHICSRCFKPGWRFSIKRKNPYGERFTRKNCRDYGYPVWDTGGHLFRCPHCEYKCNADINAACNVAAKFFGLWSGLDGLKRDQWVYTWQENQPKTFDAKKTFLEWALDVRNRKLMGDSPF